MQYYNDLFTQDSGLIILSFYLFSLIGIEGKAFAEDTIKVTAEGKGKNYEEALENAFQEAVRKAFGILIINEQMALSGKLVEEKIITRSRGYITSYEILYKNNYGNEIRIIATTSSDLLHQALSENNIDPIELRKEMEALNFSIEKNIGDTKTVNNYIGTETGSVSMWMQGYSIEVTGYEVYDRGAGKIKGYYLTKISLDDFYWNNWKDLMKSASYSSGSQRIPGMFTGCNTTETTYLASSDVKPPPVHSISTHVKGSNNYEYIIRINRNMIEFYAGSVGSLKEEPFSLSNFFTRGTIYSTGVIKCGNYIIFKKPVTLKIPFEVDNVKEIEDVVLHRKDPPFSIDNIKTPEFTPSNPYRSDNNYPSETVQEQFNKLSVNHGPTSLSSSGGINGDDSGKIFGEPVYVWLLRIGIIAFLASQPSGNNRR